MADLRFPRWLAAVGIFGGVMIALVLPVAVLMLGEDLSAIAKLTVIILAMIIGSLLAGVSAVVGITIPTAVAGGALKIAQEGCCPPEEECCPPEPPAPSATD
jgi:hypothetical protein